MRRYIYYGSSNPHISEWRTTTVNETVTLPYEASGIYDGFIDWGDGTTSVNSFANRSHVYSTAGFYNITIYGSVVGFNFNISTSKTKIYRIFQWGSNFNLGNNGACFNGCTNLNLTVVSDVLSTQNISTFSNLFKDCTSITTINRISEWNISNITNLNACFTGCTNFNQNISSWNVVNVTIMSSMFNNCINFNQNIGSWNVSNVNTMLGMFINCTNFNQNIGSWNVSNVTNMSFMFQNAINFNQNIGSWNTLAVTNMNSMFRSATAFNQNIGNWDIRNCLNFTNFMFGKTFNNYSTTNYDALLIGWASRPVKPNISINFGTIKRTSASTAARLVLTSSPNLWTIVDGGI